MQGSKIGLESPHGDRQTTDVPVALRLSYEDITILPVMDPANFLTIHGADFSFSASDSWLVTDDGSIGARGEADDIWKSCN